MTDNLIRGEEWRHVSDVDRAEYANLPSDGDVVAEAKKNIERHRKGDVAIRLVDSAGKPMRGVRVALQQRRHHLVFGNCAGSTFASLAAKPGEAARAKHFVELFNGTHAKCYWDENWHQPIEKQQGRRVMEQFLAECDWACANNLEVRGHPLVWTVDKAVPKWMRKYSYEQQLRFLEHHVRSLIAAADGRIRTWDLCNEMLWEPSLRNLAKRDWPHIEDTGEMVEYIAAALRWAREEDPTAVYCINDYGLETSFTFVKTVTAAQQRKRMVELVDAMRAVGAEPDAIGTQAHIGKWFPMGVVARTFADLARAGVPIHVSEFWAQLGDHPSPEGRSEKQMAEDTARYVANFYTVAFGTPQVTQICYWSDGAFFSKDGWRTTPAYDALKGLIRKEWWSNVEAVTDGEGFIRERVFYGDHSVRWTTPSGNPRAKELRLVPGSPGDLTFRGD